MSEPFLAEIKMVGFNFAPRGWGFCDGQILPINQNQSLFSLLGTTYGGDGRTSFGLPDLRGRTPIHEGQSVGENHPLGSRSGEETHTLSTSEMPSHKHMFKVSSTVGKTKPNMTNQVFATSDRADIMPYGDNASPVQNMNADTLAHSGGGRAHDNMQPFTTVNFCIALQGLFPSRN